LFRLVAAKSRISVFIQQAAFRRDDGAIAVGYERATFGDWKMHLNTLFPEARLKSTLEVRSSDSLPSRLGCAVPALFTGILYDDQALSEADAFAREKMEEAESLVQALRKLTEKNLSNLTPHPLYSGFYYSHPTLLEREHALRMVN